MEFRGSFKDVWEQAPCGRFRVGDALLMVAPNRYRKMRSSPIEGPPEWMALMGEVEAAQADEVLRAQANEWPEWPNPIGLQNDMFDEYLAWEIT